MRWTLSALATLAAAALLLGQTTAPQPDESARPAAATDLDPGSYAGGFMLGEEIRAELRDDGVGIDPDLLVKGFRDGLEGRDPLRPREDLEAILVAVHNVMEERMVQRLLADDPEFREAFERNRRRSEGFHELFGQQPGVTTLTSGVQYKELRPGSGRMPQPTDVVVINERVTLLDGTMLVEGTGSEVRLDRIIEGGRRLLQIMPVGAKWQFAIPPEMAHGEAGAFPIVGPNETIVGVVELVAIR